MNYDYHKFVHPVPCGTTLPKGTQVRRMDLSKHFTETFFTTRGDFEVPASHSKTYYLDYDITAQKLPTKLSSVIYNVRTSAGAVFSVAVYQGGHTWSAFIKHDHTTIFTPEIESFDTTPPEEEADA